MATLTIKNIPEPLHNALKEQAKLSRRSLNSEVIARLEQTTASTRIDPDLFLADIKSLRQNISGFLNEQELRDMKNQGRP